MNLKLLTAAVCASFVFNAHAQTAVGALEAQANVAQDGTTVVRHVRAVLARSGVSTAAIETWLRANSAALSRMTPERISAVLSATKHWELDLAFVMSPIEKDTTFGFAQAMELGNLVFAPTSDRTKIGLASEKDQQLVFTPITPCRIADSRASAGGPGQLQANAPRLVSVAGLASFRVQGGSNGGCGLNTLPPGEIKAVVAAVTTFNQNNSGTLTAFETGASNPAPAGVIQSYQSSEPMTSFAVLSANPLAGASTTLLSTSRVDYSVDVVGYFARPSATTLDCVNVTDNSIIARLTSFYLAHPACPSGYTKVSASCFGSAGASTPNFGAVSVSVPTSAYLSGAGPAGCTYQNATISSQAVGAETRCCRIPGR